MTPKQNAIKDLKITSIICAIAPIYILLMFIFNPIHATKDQLNSVYPIWIIITIIMCIIPFMRYRYVLRFNERQSRHGVES